ncbi:hypothetical protein [Maridesulfovibrio zosterae]|uniref:hypothetical protein n=1 Tax=Maridesulfovibrio zosterae TaxID=82171 RepID=UPI000423FA25|nr:hypothetical protein [Maridesulfovibrio zosterae]
MADGLILKAIPGVASFLCAIALFWNKYLHNSLVANRKEVEAVKLDVAKNYVSHSQMDKYFSQMEKRFDRLEAKIDSKEGK